MVDIKGRKIEFLRTHLNPGIGPMPNNAHNFTQMGAYSEILAIGVYVKTKLGHEHLIPYSNIQCIQLAPEEKAAPQAEAPNKE